MSRRLRCGYQSSEWSQASQIYRLVVKAATLGVGGWTRFGEVRRGEDSFGKTSCGEFVPEIIRFRRGDSFQKMLGKRVCFWGDRFPLSRKNGRGRGVGFRVVVKVHGLSEERVAGCGDRRQWGEWHNARRGWVNRDVGGSRTSPTGEKDGFPPSRGHGRGRAIREPPLWYARGGKTGVRLAPE